MKFFEDWQRRERSLVKAKEGLTEQLNRQNMTFQKQGLHLQDLQHAMNKSEARCRSLLSCCNQAQQACVQLNQELQAERKEHKNTRLELEFEFKEHSKTERELEHYYFTLNRLSDFLTLVQVSSREEKSIVMNYFNNNHSIGILSLDIEAKRQHIANLEHKLDITKQEYEYSITSHQEAIEVKVSDANELDGDRPQLALEAVQEVIGKGEKARSKRRNSSPKTKIPTKIKK